MPVVLVPAAFTLVWWALADGAWASWVVGVPAVAVASVLTLRPVQARGAFSLRGAIGFGGFFVSRSVVAGVDVARRVLDPRLPIEPGFLQYRSCLPPGQPAAVLFTVALNLLPGTICVGWTGDVVLVHALVRSPSVHDDLRALELRVARMLRHRDAAGVGAP